eukprot:CAMPEP_0113638572 /NCGR_PEP_ID=MMETSP0017_2-20120614/20211_1 /TAXON_ID=2856 /ORGANISM="Cylindrotheca closterium" /LENGTH=91 /DNA_ID=CAMNT_0000549695 /DNA_START=55 /DNA_END=330 /DNA_ORIENTATION=+ /assembly_acc=CAM_ASM_000147
MKAKVISANSKLLDIIDVVRTRSTDSTESVNTLSKATPRLSSAMGAVSNALDWRNKEETSIFRSRPGASEIPDMFTIQRCNAFEESDSDEE